MTGRWAAAAGVLLAGIVTWGALRNWVPGGAERFYLLIPPALLALALIRCEDRRAWIRSQGRLLLAYGAFMVLLSLAWGAETLLAGYFLLAIVTLLVAIFGLIRQGVQWLDERWHGPPPADAPLPAIRALVRRYVPVLVFLPLVLPYLLGVFFVHRPKSPNVDPAAVLAGRIYEDVTFKTSDGYTLRGWFFPAPRGESPRTLLVCHGLVDNRSAVLGFVEAGDAVDANVLVFDFRGHGASQGHTASIGYHEKHDVLAAIDFLRRERPDECRELFALGVSMGASSLVRAAAEVEPPLDGLVLDSAFASVVELTDNILRAYPAVMRPYLTRVGLPLASLHAGCWLFDLRPIDQVANLRTPVLFIHAPGDELIPVEHSQRLFERASEPKSLWITSAGGHVSAFALERAEYLRRVKELTLRPR